MYCCYTRAWLQCSGLLSLCCQCHCCEQELGQPVLTLDDGIAAGSYFHSSQTPNGILSACRDVGKPQNALATARNVIKGAR